MPVTTIVERQIADNSITDAKVKSGAAIATSKLAAGVDFLQRGGSVVMTGNLNMGSQRIVSLQTATADGEAVNLGQMNIALANALSPFTNKGTVRAASTANLTLSGPQTLDGVSVVAGNRVLAKNQTTPGTNGVYVVAAGAWTRSLDMDDWDEVPGGWITVQEGTVNADTLWISTADQGGSLNTTAIAFVNPFSSLSPGYGASNFVDKEVPSGAINGVNTAFTLANTPISGTEHIFLNGLLQESGSGNDYTISAASITMLAVPLTGEKIRVSYRKV